MTCPTGKGVFLRDNTGSRRYPDGDAVAWCRALGFQWVAMKMETYAGQRPWVQRFKRAGIAVYVYSDIRNSGPDRWESSLHRMIQLAQADRLAGVMLDSEGGWSGQRAQAERMAQVIRQLRARGHVIALTTHNGWPYKAIVGPATSFNVIQVYNVAHGPDRGDSTPRNAAYRLAAVAEWERYGRPTVPALGMWGRDADEYPAYLEPHTDHAAVCFWHAYPHRPGSPVAEQIRRFTPSAGLNVAQLTIPVALAAILGLYILKGNA